MVRDRPIYVFQRVAVYSALIVLSAIFLSIIGALQLFDLVWVTTKGGPIGASSTMATFLYDQFRKGLFGYASAVSIVIFGLSLVVALFYQRVALRRDLEGTGLVG